MNRNRSYQSATGRTPSLFGSAPAQANALPADLKAIEQARICAGQTPGWWEHRVDEVRLAAAGEADVLTHRVVAADLVQPGFLIRLQHQYEQLYENILTANGAQASLLTWFVRVNERLLDRDWFSSPKDGAQWAPFCVKTGDIIRISVAANIATHFANGGTIRVRAEIAIAGDLPEFTPFDGRCNTMRTASVTLAAGPLVPTLLIGPGSVFAATFPQPNLFIIPNTLVIAVGAGAPTVNVHGVSTGGVIDAGGEPIVPGLPPNWVYPADRLEKVALAKPLVGAAVVSIRFGMYD